MSRKRKANSAPAQDRPFGEPNSNPTNNNPSTVSNISSITDPASSEANDSSHSGQRVNSFQPGAPLMRQDPNNTAQMHAMLQSLSILLNASNVDVGISHSQFHNSNSRFPPNQLHAPNNAPLPLNQSTLLALLQMLLELARQTQASPPFNHATRMPPFQQEFMQIPAGTSFGQPIYPHQPPTSFATIAHSQDSSQSAPPADSSGPQESEASAANETSPAPFTLYMSCDDHMLSDYQCLVRKQIELFAASDEDICTIGQGRNRRVQVGQVGVRCKHCSHIPQLARTKGAVYFPFKIDNLYQASQNIAAVHLCGNCPNIPASTKSELQRLAKEPKSTAGGGKTYWSEGVRVAGVVEDEEGRLRFGDS